MLSQEEKERRKQERSLEYYNKTHKEINGIIYKQCNKHNEHFPDEDDWFLCNEEYFYKNKSGIDGFHPYCKRCSIIKSSQWTQENSEHRSQHVREWNQKPEVNKRNLSVKRIWKENNKDKIYSYTKKFQTNKKDKIKEYQKKRQQNKEHVISKQEWTRCKEYFDNSCAYCGISEIDAKEQQGNYLHKEHVDHEGANDLSNCIPACKSCNSKKWVHTLKKWYTEDNPVFNIDRLNKIYKWLNEDYKLYIENHG